MTTHVRSHAVLRHSTWPCQACLDPATAEFTDKQAEHAAGIVDLLGLHIAYSQERLVQSDSPGRVIADQLGNHGKERYDKTLMTILSVQSPTQYSSTELQTTPQCLCLTTHTSTLS